MRDPCQSLIAGRSFAWVRHAAVVLGTGLLACTSAPAQVPERSGDHGARH